MSDTRTATREILVHLVRPGVESQDYRLSEGATLADLLRLAQASTARQAVLIDGSPPEEALSLRAGMVVTIVPSARNQPWQQSIPALEDADLAREYFAILKARRDADLTEDSAL